MRNIWDLLITRVNGARTRIVMAKFIKTMIVEVEDLSGTMVVHGGRRLRNLLVGPHQEATDADKKKVAKVVRNLSLAWKRVTGVTVGELVSAMK